MKKILLVLLVATFFTGCAVYKYPGQPGIKTNSFARIDFEVLLEGENEKDLYIYETTYDNSSEGAGVGAIVTRLYKNAPNFTSNVRTNSDGTVYRIKEHYKGGVVQAISIPQSQQIYVPYYAEFAFLINFSKSLDETDNRNLVEEKVFEAISIENKTSPFESIKEKLDIIRAGTLLADGTLSYKIQSIKLGNSTLDLNDVEISTNIYLSSLHLKVKWETIKKLKSKFEKLFPSGFSGDFKIYLKDLENPITLSGLGVHTLKTAKNRGIVIHKGLKSLE